MHSALDTSVVQAYLDMKVALKRIVGPVAPHLAPRGTQFSLWGNPEAQSARQVETTHQSVQP